MTDETASAYAEPTLTDGTASAHGDKPTSRKKTSHRKRRDLGPATHVFSVLEFCDAHRISKSKFYQLRKDGLGPVETRVGAKCIITFEAAAAWRRRNTKRLPKP